jgi:uncharacterized protein YpmB
MSNRILKLILAITILFTVIMFSLALSFFLAGCSGKESEPQSATALGSPQIELKEQTIVPSYGNYEGGMLYHYYDKSAKKNIYIFNGTNKAGVCLR